MPLPLLFLLVLLPWLSACAVTSVPADNRGFVADLRLEQLAGSYRNRGEGAPEAAPVYLSALLWPDREDLPHAGIDRVEVAVEASDRLRVSAYQGLRPVHVGRYQLGHDFNIRDGRILVRRDFGMAGFKIGEPVLGPYQESLELGLDQTGQGKSRQRFRLLGLGYLIVPLAVSGQTDVRFARLAAPGTPP